MLQLWSQARGTTGSFASKTLREGTRVSRETELGSGRAGQGLPSLCPRPLGDTTCKHGIRWLPAPEA